MTPQGKRFVVLWAVGLALLLAAGGYSGLKIIRGGAAKSRTAHTVPTTQPQDVPISDAASAAKPVDVRVGISINRAGDFELKQSLWTADFDLWFLWNHPTAMPGEHFDLVHGEILEQSITDQVQSGAERYIEYHIVARMKMDFDPTRFPFGDVCLQIPVKDTSRGDPTVRYVADEQDSGISPDAAPRAVAVRSFDVTTGAGRDMERAARIRAAGGEPAHHSQFTARVWVVPQGVGIYRRMFQALFASVAVALIALYIKPTHVDCRFGLPVGGFFASVSNNIFVGSMLPFSNAPTLTDVINAVSLLTVFLILIQSVISLYIYDTLGQERLSIHFDRVSLVVFLIGYLALNLMLPMAAISP